MTKLLNEILENQPELEKNKDSLEKVINSLEENNPKIMASKEFKESLKSRIDWLIWIKQNKKSNFVIFAVPVFSFMFVIWWFFYYFKDINFFDNNWNISESQLSKITEDKVLNNELDDKISTFEAEILSEVNIENQKIDKENVILEDTEITKSENIRTLKTATPAAVRTMWISADINKDIEQDNIEETNSNDDNQIIDLLDSIEQEIWETFDESISDQDIEAEIDSIMEFGLFSDESFDTMENQIIEYSFEEFCRDNLWEISGTGETLKCIKNNIECGSSDFEKWACSFDETK